MKYAIVIGAQKETVKEVRLAINEILKAPHADQKTKQIALKMLNQICAVNNVNISNCSINEKKDK